MCKTNQVVARYYDDDDNDEDDNDNGESTTIMIGPGPAESDKIILQLKKKLSSRPKIAKA